MGPKLALLSKENLDFETDLDMFPLFFSILENLSTEKITLISQMSYKKVISSEMPSPPLPDGEVIPQLGAHEARDQKEMTCNPITQRFYNISEHISSQ